MRPRRAVDRRRRIVWLALSWVVGIAGLILSVVTEGAVAVIGGGLIAVAAVALISLVFFEVGISEERASERDRASRGRPRERP
jgi:hypothetical protein